MLINHHPIRVVSRMDVVIFTGKKVSSNKIDLRDIKCLHLTL
jgi:hypothetical protein